MRQYRKKPVVIEAVRSLRLKFTSGNDVPVTEARITRAEWEAIDQSHAAEAAQERPCTCHPDDNPPVPCPQKFAYSECVKAAQAQAQSGEWVMVPREPTEWMLQAAEDAVNAAAHCESTTDDLSAIAYKAALAAAPQRAAEPVAWTRQDVISDDGGCPIGMDEPRIAWGAECPDYEGGWAPLYTRPQPAQDAKDAAIPLKGWIFDKVDMGRGDERYICTPNGSNATTVRNETTSDHREQMLWLIADAMAKESGR